MHKMLIALCLFFSCPFPLSAQESDTTLSAKLKQALKDSPFSAGNDPFPKVIKMPVPIVTDTIGYWAGGAASQTRSCYSIQDMKSFVTVITSSRARVTGRGTCQIAPFCDSHNEFCEDVTVTLGCWVREDIYNWYIAEVGNDVLDNKQKEILCHRLFPDGR